ncbi:MAG: exosortase/archaeosortase family protein [Vicinamibacterales bacterium]
MPEMFRGRAQALSFICLLAAFALLYGRLLVDVSRIWSADANYSHGFLILPLVGYFVWERRVLLLATPVRQSPVGLVLIVCSVGVLLIGTVGVEFFLMRTSALGVVVGTILFLAGWGWLRGLAFPLGLSLLMIPLPPVVFYQIAFPLQLLATKFGVAILNLTRIPVLREGNVIALAHTTLEVTEACSGIRSLLSLLALAILYGYFTTPKTFPRIVIALSSVPIAIVANGLRIAGTGISAQYVGPWAATGFFHTFSGWTVFMTSFVMLLAVGRLLNGASSLPAIRQPEPA